MTMETKPLAEADCIALAAWIDNEIESMRSTRRWITDTYMPDKPRSWAPRVAKRPFTVTDILEHLLLRRRKGDKRLVEMMNQIMLALRAGKKSGFKHPLHEEL